MRIKNKIPWSELSSLPDSKKLGQRKVLILDAALKILATHGVQELSLTRISKETELSKSLVLYHFASKTKILEELYFFNNKILTYLLNRNLENEIYFERKVSAVLQALSQWFFYNDEITELILLMFHEAGKSTRLTALYKAYRENIQLTLERIFLESMRYSTLEEVKIAVSGVLSLTLGTLISSSRNLNTSSREDELFNMRINVEALLKVEIPATELQPTNYPFMVSTPPM